MNKRKASEVCDEPDKKSRKVEHDDKLEFYDSPKSLEDMAGFTVALSLWYHENAEVMTKSRVNRRSRRYHDYDPYYDDEYYDDEYSSSDNSLMFVKFDESATQLRIPEKIKQDVSNFTIDIKNEFNAWIKYYDQRIFFPFTSSNLAIEMVDEIVWNSNGYIDWLGTAKNLLLSPRLSDVHKFRIMCTYCIEDQLELVPASLVSGKYKSKVNFQDHPLIYYWNCRLKNDIKEYGGYSSIESYIMATKKLDNWIAIEYFLKRLDYDDQIVKAINLIKEHGMKYQKKVLSLLNDSQQHRVFMDCAKTIMFNFLTHSTNKEYALNVWNRCKSIVSDVQFADVMQYLLDSGFYDAEKGVFLNSLASHMWKTAPEQVRSRTIDEKYPRLFRRFFQYDFYGLNAEILELMMMMLSDASLKVKVTIFDEHLSSKFFLKLLKTTNARFLNDFLKLRFTENELGSFKKTMMSFREIEEYCVTLVKAGDLSRLTDSLEMLLSSTDAPTFKANLVKSSEIINYCIELMKTEDADKLNALLKTLTSDGDLLSLTTDLMSSTEMTEYCVELIKEENFVKLNHLLGTYLHSDFVQPFRRNLMFSSEIQRYCLTLMKEEAVIRLHSLLRTLLPETCVLTFTSDLMNSITMNFHCMELIKNNQITKLNFLFASFLREADVQSYKSNLICSPQIMHYCMKLIQEESIILLHYLLVTFLPKTEIPSWKINLMNSPEIVQHCIKLIKEKDGVGKLNNILAAHLSEADVKEFKIKLLTSKAIISFCLLKLRSNEFKFINKLIYDVIPDVNAVNELKKKIFTSPLALSEYRNKLREGKLDELKSSLAELLSVDVQKEVKNELLLMVKTILISGESVDLEKINLNGFFAWCLNPEELIDFKNSLPFEGIFIKLLTSSIFRIYNASLRLCHFQLESNFTNVNCFLNWYFSSARQIKDYKIRLIDQYRRIDFITTLLRKKNRSYLEAVMKWFFDDDQDEVLKFKKKYFRLRISQYI